MTEASPDEIVSELTYKNYKHNVLINPRTPLERWEGVYGPAAKGFAQRLKTEISKN